MYNKFHRKLIQLSFIPIFLSMAFFSQAQSLLVDLSDIEAKIHRDTTAALDDLYGLEPKLTKASAQEKIQWLILSLYTANQQNNRQAIFYFIEKSQLLLTEEGHSEKLWLKLFANLTKVATGELAELLKVLQQLELEVKQQLNPLLSAYFNRQLYFAYAMNGAIDFALDTALSNYEEWRQLEQYYFSAEMLYQIADLRSNMGDIDGANIALKKATAEANRLNATNLQIATVELEAGMLLHQNKPQAAYDKLNNLLTSKTIHSSHDRYDSVLEKMAYYSYELKQFQQTANLAQLLLAKQQKENKNTEFSELLLLKAFIQLNEFEQATPLITSLSQTFIQQGNRFGIFEIKNAQLDMHHRTGDIDGLFHSAKSIIELVTAKDNSNLDKKRSQRSNTLVQAKTQEKKVKRLTQSNEIQREELNLSKELIDSKNRNLLLLSIFCLLLIAIFIWLFYLLKKVHLLANTDGLTGINNRRAGLKKSNELLRKNKAKRSANYIAIAMLDLDHFKNINDTFGHDVGDQVIKLTTQLSLKHLTKHDIICRMGGEEFMFMLSTPNRETLLTIIERIRQEICQYDTSRLGLTSQISVSIGVTSVSETSPEKSLTDYLIDADTALYHAKNNGRNQVQHFDQIKT